MNILDVYNPAVKKNRKRKILIAGFIILFILGIGLATYPVWPSISYALFPPQNTEEIPGVPESAAIIEQEKEQSEQNAPADTQDTETSAEEPVTTPTDNANSNIDTKINLLIIPKIGVKIPIIEGTTESVLNSGAWRLPETSTPDQGGNTAIAGHRWKYRPPSEKTFYLLDKLEIGDTFKIIWDGKDYNYKIIGVSVVLPTDVWVLNPTQKSVVTLITCTPLFSTKNRLVVKGELVE